MPQIINDSPGIGALIGTGLGQGISSGLQQLAQLKTNQLLASHQRKQTASGLEAIGFPKEQAYAVAGFSPELQSLVIKNYLSAAQSAGLDQALQNVQINPESQSGIPGMQELGAPVQQNQPRQQSPLQQLLGIQQPNVLDRQLPTEKVFADLMSRQPSQVAQEAPAAQKQQALNKEPQKQTEEKRNNLADTLLRPRLTPEHRLKVEALKQQKDLAQQRLNATEQASADKETKPTYDKIQKEYKSAQENDARIQRMKQLLFQGELNSPGYYTFLKGFGTLLLGSDLTGLLNADSQEFEKLSNDLIKGAKDYFGGRLTNEALKAFFKTIPTLSQSNDGRLRVIDNLEAFIDAAKVNKAASDKVLKANNGRRPRNYDQLVDEVAGPDLDKIATKFKKGYGNQPRDLSLIPKKT
jgi:hypothetical protein